MLLGNVLLYFSEQFNIALMKEEAPASHLYGTHDEQLTGYD